MSLLIVLFEHKIISTKFLSNVARKLVTSSRRFLPICVYDGRRKGSADPSMGVSSRMLFF